MKKRIRATAVIIQADKILTFFAIDPHNGREYYFLPGGEIEKTETAPEAAERETLEETGFTITVNPKTAVDKEYKFHWNNQDFDVLTIFYRGLLTPAIQKPKKVEDAAYNKEVRWIDVNDVDKFLGYVPEIADAVKEIIRYQLPF